MRHIIAQLFYIVVIIISLFLCIALWEQEQHVGFILALLIWVVAWTFYDKSVIEQYKENNLE